jgi:hypothetical protein
MLFRWLGVLLRLLFCQMLVNLFELLDNLLLMSVDRWQFRLMKIAQDNRQDSNEERDKSRTTLLSSWAQTSLPPTMGSAATPAQHVPAQNLPSDPSVPPATAEQAPRTLSPQLPHGRCLSIEVLEG